MMNKTIKLGLIGLLTGSLAAIYLPCARAAQALPQAVTYTKLQGNYTFFAPTGDENYYQGVGTITFDGKGHVTGVMTYNAGDTICVGMTVTGTYTVYPGTAMASAQMALASTNTSNCGNLGNGDTLSAAISIGAGSNILYIAEMDPATSGYFAHDFEFFGGTMTHY
jgi:hypothetical protein